MIAQIPGRDDVVFKLLSVDPQNYRDAPTEAVRRVLELVEGRDIPRGEKLNAAAIGESPLNVDRIGGILRTTTESCRIGTTVATNALLEHKGKAFALLTTKGI